VCSNLLGKRYELGADGSGETIDCIALTVSVLDHLGIGNPGVLRQWYSMGAREILRELNHYTERIEQPTYDGDIVVLRSPTPAFGAAWQGGILYINQSLQRVDWKPAAMLSIHRSYRMKRS
jgi:hypothetical protein